LTAALYRRKNSTKRKSSFLDFERTINCLAAETARYSAYVCGQLVRGSLLKWVQY
jgi:hypothetical protein